MRQKSEKELRCWIAGCSRGEEAYSLVLLWKFILQERYPEMTISLRATDIDPEMILQARKACYVPNSVKRIKNRRASSRQHTLPAPIERIKRSGSAIVGRLRSKPPKTVTAAKLAVVRTGTQVDCQCSLFSVLPLIHLMR
ncbi:CheR family methyltransferase [Methylomarinum sp. Ch1-1]|uniref:CheR family methyltransferase n=1 Tax=Methylomarinum roseum TaxID=3067653 RepID=A0AAU7NS26_9GAMM|nr:CheR family methyltransferase [Methylomarinum sp. Ch1-1]MDP4520220.1 CheR family methyltransferase [Methylomarinum sp. Ch1-1]